LRARTDIADPKEEEKVMISEENENENEEYKRIIDQATKFK
jgi:hypothetical protein